MRPFKAITMSAAVAVFGLLVQDTAWADDQLELRGSSDTQAHLPSLPNFEWKPRPSLIDGVVTGSVQPAKQSVKLENSDLRQFVETSLLENDALRATKHDVNSAQEAKLEARFALLPELNYSADYKHTNVPPSSGGWRSERTTFSNSLNATWNFFNSGTGLAAIRAADFTAIAYNANFLVQERQELMDSLGVYLQIYAGQQLIFSLQNTRKNLSSIRHSVSKQFRAGLTSRTDIAYVDAEIAALDGQIEAAKRQLAQQKVVWKSKTGKDVVGSLAKPDARTLLEGDRKTILERALNGNVTLASADFTALAAVEKSKSDMASFLPGVSAYLSGVSQDSSSGFSSSDYEWKAGIKLTVPILNLKGTSRYRQSREAAQAAHFRAQDTRKQVVDEIEANWESVSSYRKSSQIFKQKIVANEQVVTGVRKEVQAGLKPIEDLLREEIKLASSKIERLQNEVNEIAASYRIAMHFADLTLDDFVTK